MRSVMLMVTARMFIVLLVFPLSALFLTVVSLVLIALAPFSNRTVVLLLAICFVPLRLAVFPLAPVALAPFSNRMVVLLLAVCFVPLRRAVFPLALLVSQPLPLCITVVIPISSIIFPRDKSDAAENIADAR